MNYDLEGIKDIFSSVAYRKDIKFPGLLERNLKEGVDQFDGDGNLIVKSKDQIAKEESKKDDGLKVLDVLTQFRDVVKVKNRVIPKINVVVDYLKVEFFWGFSVGDSECENLFELLKLDDVLEHHDDCRGRDNFDCCWTIADQSFILFKPNENAQKNGYDDYFILEMTGQGCQAFEARGGDWLELIRFINSSSHETKRIDLAGDDMAGICPLEEVKAKINERCYISNFRSRNSLKLGNQEFVLEASPKDPFAESADVKDYQKGYSCTWGKKDNIQLQIYDKKAERLAKGIRTIVDSTIRYEMRFGSSRGDVILLLMEIAYEKKCVGVLYSCLLKWLLEFKEEDNGASNQRNLNKVATWSKWDELLGTCERIAIPVRQKDMEATITKARSWITNQWASTAKMLVGIDPLYFFNVLGIAVQRNYKDKGITESEFSQIATFLHYHPEFGEFSRENVVANVREFIAKYCPYGENMESDDEDEFDGAFDSHKY